MTARLLPDVDAATYHADQFGETPTLSAGIIRTLLTGSPAHAKAAHPKLNPAYESKQEEKFDVGLAAHRLLLEGENAIEVVVADNWRTASAREHRDEARAYGRIPLLAADADKVVELAAAIRVQVAQVDADPPLLTNGQPEVTLTWDEQGVAAKARLDWLHDDLRAVDDLKTTSRTANPDMWARRTLYDHGCDIQAAWYLRGLRALEHPRTKWRWIVVETSPPYALSVITPSAAVLELANAKIDHALTIWKRCLETDQWPAYPPVLHVAELPVYEEARWLEREAREEIAA